MHDGRGGRLQADPFREIGVRHGLAVGRRVQRRGRDGVDEDALALQFLGERHRHGRHRGLAGGIGDHAGAAARVEAGPGGHVDDAPRRAGDGPARQRLDAEEGGALLHMRGDLGPDVDDGRDLDAGFGKVEGGEPGTVVRGDDDRALAHLDAVAVEIGARGARHRTLRSLR